MDTSELLKRVRKIEIKTRRLSKHFFSGDYHSAFKGRGMSFSEVRAYQYGDEVRDIDWNVTARTGEPHVKVFEEERELTVMLLVDISKSVFFGTHEFWKHEWIAELSAVLGFSALQNNDKIGLILFSDQIELYIPPKKGRQHLLRIIRELLFFDPVGKSTDMKVPLAFLTRVMKKNCIAFVLSDFISPPFTDELRIAAGRHEVIGLHVYDPAEVRLPKAGLVSVQDAEQNVFRVLDTGDEATRNWVQAQFEQRTAMIRDQFSRARCDMVSLQTNEPYVPALHRLFKRRAAS